MVHAGACDLFLQTGLVGQRQRRAAALQLVAPVDRRPQQLAQAAAEGDAGKRRRDQLGPGDVVSAASSPSPHALTTRTSANSIDM